MWLNRRRYKIEGVVKTIKGDVLGRYTTLAGGLYIYASVPVQRVLLQRLTVKDGSIKRGTLFVIRDSDFQSVLKKVDESVVNDLMVAAL